MENVENPLKVIDAATLAGFITLTALVILVAFNRGLRGVSVSVS